ncbi:MAG: PQQ-binding-like beta-propeller repeat protein, partial [Ktedonobacterales bacterium]|nr:PQQ-binding-like beta-propeller repeat protein [Ktedonobacterales bacterium]
HATSGAPVRTYQTSGKVVSTPVIVNNTLYVGSDDASISAFRLV